MKKNIYFILIVMIISVSIFEACSPIREFMNWPTYKGNNNFNYTYLPTDTTKKTILIIADNEGTEIFDMLAPYYLFNATEQANVYIIAEKKTADYC